MTDAGIELPAYRPIREAIDRIITDDLRHSDLQMHDLPVTWLEALRTSLGVSLARRSGPMPDQDAIATMIDLDGIQEWLDFLVQVGSGGAKTIGGECLTQESYGRNPGIRGWERITAYSFSGSFNGGPGSVIHWDRLRSTFRDEHPVVDEEVLDMIVDELDPMVRATGARLILPETPGRHGHVAIRVEFPNGRETAVSGQPFALSTTTLMQDADVAFRLMPQIGPLARAMEKIIAESGWPSERTCRPAFSFHRSGMPNTTKIERMTIGIEFDSIAANLEEIEDRRHIATIDLPDGAGADQMVAAFETNTVTGGTGVHLLKHGLKIEIATLRKRAKRVGELGEGKIYADSIAHRILSIVAEHMPERMDDVLSGKRKKLTIPVEAYGGLVTGRIPNAKPDKPTKARKKTEGVSFSLQDGRLRCRISLSDDVSWQVNRMLVSGLPTAVMKAVIGRSAREIMDHPIADLLGPVTNAYPHARNMRQTWLTFEPVWQEVSRIPS